MSYFSLLKTHYAQHKVPLKLSIACLFNYFRVINTLHSLKINYLSTASEPTIHKIEADIVVQTAMTGNDRYP